ncbi:MAG: alpha/beta fold hydrolase [Cytophagales bacterium]|nr:MAG: alpha/beta fold hydrolase [Cytophagales bacterium]
MKLYYRVLGHGAPMIIMHGVFGTCDNWITVSKNLAEHYQVFLLDLRNHGQSPHSTEFSYEAMANDLSEFIESHQLIRPIIIGHSMGGKVAMKYAATFDNISSLIVADIAPRFYKRHHDQILNGLNALPLNKIKSRIEADEILATYISELSVRQFLLKNLFRNDQGEFQWRLNLPVITKNIDIVGEAQVSESRINIPTLFIKGEKSNYIRKEDEISIHQIFSNAKIVEISNAGHWVQAEEPLAFIDAVISFLK